MFNALLISAYTLAMGFVAAGVFSSGYRLVTDAPLKFGPGKGSEAARVIRGALLVVAGPLILVGNAYRAAVKEQRPVGWLIASGVIAGAWSFCLGLALINVVTLVGGVV